jgi:CBS domain containing-hemolysin-like protein
MASSCLALCGAAEQCVASCTEAQEPMTSGQLAGSLTFTFFLLLGSACFSGLTLGLLSLDMPGLELIEACGEPDDRRYAKAIMPLRARGNLLLCTLLLGNTFVNSFIAITTAGLTEGLTGTVLSTGFILIFGEIIPQAVCSRYALFIGAKSTYFVRAFMLLFLPISYPISRLLDHALGRELRTIYNRKELDKLLSIAVEDPDGDLRPEEKHLMSSALAFSEKRASMIMTRLDHTFCIEVRARPRARAARSRVDAAAVRGCCARSPQAPAARAVPCPALRPPFLTRAPSRAAPAFGSRLQVGSKLSFEALLRCYKSGFTRIPVYRRDPSCVVGLLFTKDLILVDPDDEIPVGAMLSFCGRSLHVVGADTTIDKLLAAAQTQRSHLFFVVEGADAPGEVLKLAPPLQNVIGIVTLEDVLEELIAAEIVDETDTIRDNHSRLAIDMNAALRTKRMEFFYAIQVAAAPCGRRRARRRPRRSARGSSRGAASRTPPVPLLPPVALSASPAGQAPSAPAHHRGGAACDHNLSHRER